MLLLIWEVRALYGTFQRHVVLLLIAASSGIATPFNSIQNRAALVQPSSLDCFQRSDQWMGLSCQLTIPHPSSPSSKAIVLLLRELRSCELIY